jgi:hypothetical protein
VADTECFQLGIAFSIGQAGELCSAFKASRAYLSMAGNRLRVTDLVARINNDQARMFGWVQRNAGTTRIRYKRKDVVSWLKKRSRVVP